MKVVVDCAYEGCGSKFTKRGKERYCSRTCTYYAMMHRRAKRHAQQGRGGNNAYLCAPPPGKARTRKIREQEDPSPEYKVCALPTCGKVFHRGGMQLSRWRTRRYCSRQCSDHRPGARRRQAPQSPELPS